jgi:catalase
LGINYDQIPINQPVCPFAYNHRDGQHRMSINTGLNYYPNRKNHAPPSTPEQGAWSTSKVKVAEGIQDRIQGPKFNEHYNQATLFYNSLSEPEKEHFVSAVQFELGKCDEHEVQQRIVDKYNIIDHDLAVKIASAFGDLKVPDEVRPNHGKKSAFLSQVTGKNQRFTASGRQVGIFILPGFSQAAVTELKTAFLAAGVIPMVSATWLGRALLHMLRFLSLIDRWTCQG